MRLFYLLILGLHPREFFADYGGELLWIFEQETGTGSSEFALIVDGLISLARQWVIRRAAWKWAVGIVIAGLFVANTLAVVFTASRVH